MLGQQPENPQNASQNHKDLQEGIQLPVLPENFAEGSVYLPGFRLVNSRQDENQKQCTGAKDQRPGQRPGNHPARVQVFFAGQINGKHK